MPWGDRTGPWGAGPMTGRGMGYCAGYAAPGYMNPGPGVGFGRGRGFGRGFGRGLGRGRFWGVPAQPVGYAPAQPVRYVPVQAGQVPEYTREYEVADLKAEKELVERELEDIRTRLKELERKGTEKKK